MIQEAVETGNITRSKWPDRDVNNLNVLYTGNGRMGCCLDLYGLMNTPFNESGSMFKTANTALHHADHWTRGAYGLDFYLPAARLLWEDSGAVQAPVFYRQEQNIYDGIITTTMHFPECRMAMRACFSHVQKDVLAVELTVCGDVSGLHRLVLLPLTEYLASYEQQIKGSMTECSLGSDNRTWSCRLRAGTADTFVRLRLADVEGNIDLSGTDKGATVTFGESGLRRCLLLIGISSSSRQRELQEEMDQIRTAEAFFAESRESWHKRWGDSFIKVAEPNIQAMWARSLHYIFCTLSNERHSPPSPTGWTGNGWAFHFPQDLSYVHPALLRLGHFDIAKAIVEFYHSFLGDMERYTQRIYHAKGTMWAWEFPIGHGDDLLKDGFPNWFQFEIHNAAYPARMAYETSLFVRDEDWSRAFAWPIVRETARFFSSILWKDGLGKWNLHVEPSMGQDEYGGHNRSNYLCALFSAQYSLQSAISMAERFDTGLEDIPHWRTILQDGLAFSKLYNGLLGIYNTVETKEGKADFGKQKHPVQLNPLVFLPLASEPDKYAVRAYHMRSDICGDIRFNHSSGWTLAAFWLASSHMGDGSGLLSSVQKMLDMQYADNDLIQLFESSAWRGMPFYTTAHGLYLQALQDAIVSDYWGKLQIGAAYPGAWGDVTFHGLHTRFGDVLTGRFDGGEWAVERIPADVSR